MRYGRSYPGLSREVKIGIHRIVQIEQWHRVVVTKPGVDVITHTHKVDTGQQSVVDIASGKLALQLVSTEKFCSFSSSTTYLRAR